MIDSEEPNILITFEHNVTFVRFIHDKILPTTIQIKSTIFPMVAEVIENDFDMAISKAKFWLESIVSKCIIFSKNNLVASRLFSEINNIPIPENLFMITPSEPTDEQIAMLFQAKLTALSGLKVGFAEFTIKSNNYNDLSFMFVGETVDVLPVHKEWVGERSYFDKSWWDRNDASTFDIVPPEDADLSETPKWAYSLDFLNADLNRPDEAIIHGFTPSIIDGGIE